MQPQPNNVEKTTEEEAKENLKNIVFGIGIFLGLIILLVLASHIFMAIIGDPAEGAKEAWKGMYEGSGTRPNQGYNWQPGR